jgi:adenylate cyclase class IV
MTALTDSMSGEHRDETAPPRRNIEFKARVADLAATRTRAEAVATDRCGVIEQVDTYFHVPRGRLKLREAQPGEAQLVSYHRPDAGEPRASEYRLVTIGDPAGLKAALAATLGVKAVVRKRRELLWHHNERIHLDEVEGLGSFLELEAVVGPDADERVCRQRLDFLLDALRVNSADMLPGSYSDMS